MARFQLDRDQKTIVDAIVQKTDERRKKHPDGLPLLTHDELIHFLSPQELIVAKMFLAVDPLSFKVKTPFLGMNDPPDDVSRYGVRHT